MARGHRVRRINLSLGDQLFWPLPATQYRGSLAGWRKFLAEYLTEHAVTDVVLFGDCRPYHRIAISLATHRRVEVHVCEEGYLRPNWITVERGGVNGHTSLPRDPDVLVEQARGLQPGPETTFKGSFIRRALWDISYNVANVLGRPVYPRYRRHRPNHVFVEYAGWIRRILRKGRAERAANAAVERALAHPGGFFLVPMQLDSDYQIRVHSRYPELGEFLDEVFGSFAHHGPAEAQLLVKVHPLDSGLIDRRAQAARLAAKHGLRDRVVLIEGGHLPTLLRHTRGVVVVNSTVGTTSLEVGRPTVALGTSIYNMPGLTFQDGIDRFWSEAQSPDPDLFRAFRNLIIDRTQVNGGYFCKQGVGMAVKSAADRVLAGPPGPHREPAMTADGASSGLYARPQPAE